MLNLQSKDTFYVFDEYGMLTVKSDALSWRDSIGMTVCAWIAYGMPDELVYKLEFCYNSNSCELYRHPAFNELSSRDHWSYFIIYRKLLYNGVWFDKFIKKVPRMRGMNLWMRSITGNKLAEWMYYTLYIPGAILGNWWLEFCRVVGRIGPERSNNLWIATDDDNTYGYYFQKTRTLWQKLWAWIIFQTIPAYPLHNKGWQLYVMRKVPKRDTLRKILLKRVGKSNILLRLLYGDDTVTQEEVDNYPHMTGFRPGVYLDESCRRHIRELTPQEAEFNAYERDLIVKLWIDFQQKDCKMNNEYYDYDPE